METKLTFNLKLTNGETVTQEIGYPGAPEDAPAAINQMFAQYAQIGMVVRVGARFTLTPASQITKVEVDIPSIILSSTEEVKRNGLIL